MDNAAIMRIAEQYDGIVVLLTSYKAKLIAAGFSSATAEQMAIAMHQVILVQALAKTKQ